MTGLLLFADFLKDIIQYGLTMLQLPSSEADVKAFSFDVIPASMIENMVIIKSPAPEIPADFSGGFVKITTVNLPEKNSFFITYGTGISQGTTFQTSMNYQKSSTDWLGFDNGYRALPKEMPAHLNEYESATNPEIQNRITVSGRELNKTWEPNSDKAITDQRLSVGFNRSFKTGYTVLWKYYSIHIQQHK